MFECGRMIPDKLKSCLPPGVRRGDLLLLVFFLGSAVLLAVFLALNARRGDTLQIYADGQLFYELPLMQDAVQEKGAETYLLIRFLDDGAPVFTLDAQEPELPEGTSYNLLLIQNGNVQMLAADCPDQICVRHKPVFRAQESIICLPHKLSVEITGAKGKAADTETLDGMVH